MGTPAVIVNVEDNEPNRYARHRILSAAGFTIHDASTGQQALDLVALHRPDLILLDVNLPDINGIEVCRRLKSSPDGHTVTVLQISASSTTAPHATAALNSGADGYLAEPVDSAVLIATINALMRMRRAERDLHEANVALQQANVRLASVNKDLRQSNQDLQQFAYFASHDLQEPIRQVTSFVQLLSRSANSRLTLEERKFLEIVVEGSQRMEHLIRALLSYSQLGHGERTAYAQVDLNSIVERIIADLSDRIAESGAKITRTPLPPIMGDPIQIADLFQNLIVNAIKYRSLERPLEIRISATEESPEATRISIRDNGQGIKPPYHDLIFLPFKRLHGREIPGTGIGLAICRRIVEAHGGRIWVESDPGEASVFHVSLPAPAIAPKLPASASAD
jgi:signal transduction histidine kinase